MIAPTYEKNLIDRIPLYVLYVMHRVIFYDAWIIEIGRTYDELTIGKASRCAMWVRKWTFLLDLSIWCSLSTER